MLVETKAMKRVGGEIAKRQLAKIRQQISESRLPLSKMTDEQVIQTLRKTREELWEGKVALRPR